MRQLFTWRLVAALGALLLLTLAVDRTFGVSGPTGTISTTGPAGIDENGEPLRRRVDLVAQVERIERSEDFDIGPDGLSVGFLDAVLDEQRVMRVAPGTPGVVQCRNFLVPFRCVVFADLLGDAVVWFAVMPRGPNDTVELPPIVDLEDGYAVFETGWEIRYAATIEREEDSCGEDLVSFSDFLRRFGPNSTSVVDIETSQVVEVQCGEEFVPPATTILVEGTPRGEIVSATTSTIPIELDDVERPDS